jgi:hypothetical protein
MELSPPHFDLPRGDKTPHGFVCFEQSSNAFLARMSARVNRRHSILQTCPAVCAAFMFGNIKNPGARPGLFHGSVRSRYSQNLQGGKSRL